VKIVQYMSRMRLEDGGVVRALLDICRALADRGHAVWLMTCDVTDVPRAWLQGEEGGLPRVVGLRESARYLPITIPSVLRRARGIVGGADVVHLHVPWDPVCVQLGRMARRAGVPYVVGVHGMLDDWSMGHGRLKKLLYLGLGGRRFLERAAAVQLTADAERFQAAKWYPRGRSVVVPLIFDLAGYMTLPGPQRARQAFREVFGAAGEPAILFLSRLSPKKGLEIVIEAVSGLVRRGIPCRLLVAGLATAPAYERRLHALVAARGLSDRVRFLGFVTGPDKVSLYQAADLVVLPTSQENWGYVLLESLAAGTPVVTTRGVDIWPELERSGGAMIVEPQPAAVEEAVAALLGDPERRRAMGIDGRRWVLENLNVDRVVSRYEELYRDVRAGSGDGACAA
jgi:glycosyltransferase involved in cell wall biosynthesis